MHQGTPILSLTAMWVGRRWPRCPVDIETGVVRVEEVVAVQDCGLVIDR